MTTGVPPDRDRVAVVAVAVGDAAGAIAAALAATEPTRVMAIVWPISWRAWARRTRSTTTVADQL